MIWICLVSGVKNKGLRETCVVKHECAQVFTERDIWMSNNVNVDICVCTFSVSDETALVMIRGAPSQRKAVCLIVWSDATYHPYHLHMKGNKTEEMFIYNQPMDEHRRQFWE